MFAVNNASTTLHQKLYSPLMLNSEWSRTGRFLFVLFCTSFGSTMNGFFVSSFFIERRLKKNGNIFLACAGFADLIITAGPIATSVVVLLSGQWDNLLVCRFVQFATELATYAYNLFFLLVGAENFNRVCRSSAEYKKFLSMRIGLVSISVYIISFILAAVGVSLDLDYDYCERQFYGNIPFRYITSVLFYGIPMTLTLAFLFASMSRVRNRLYRRPRVFRHNYSSIASNVTAYLMFVVAWIPYVVIVSGFPRASDGIYYNALWIGLLRSVFSGFMYGITNMYFRRAYVLLFKYCCCKSTLPGSSARRHRRAFDSRTVRSSPHHVARETLV